MVLLLKRSITAVMFLVCCAATAFATQRSSAVAGINTVQAPIPSPLQSGKKAFISYEMGDVTAFPSSYSGGPERAYSEFYADMKAWGRFELVLDPKDADVVFAVRFVDPPQINKPQIRIGISDAKTGASLWGFVEQVDFAFRKRNRDVAFSDTVQQLVGDLQTLLTTGSPPPPQP
jgi:hypothetical protein